MANDQSNSSSSAGVSGQKNNDDEKEEGEISLEDVSSSEEASNQKYQHHRQRRKRHHHHNPYHHLRPPMMHPLPMMHPSSFPPPYYRVPGPCRFCLSLNRCAPWCARGPNLPVLPKIPSIKRENHKNHKDVMLQGKENRNISKESSTKLPSSATLQEKNDDDLVPISSDSDMESLSLSESDKEQIQQIINKSVKKSSKLKNKKKNCITQLIYTEEGITTSVLPVDENNKDKSTSVRNESHPKCHCFEKGFKGSLHRRGCKIRNRSSKSPSKRHKSPMLLRSRSKSPVSKKIRIRSRSPTSISRKNQRRSASPFLNTVLSVDKHGNVSKLLKKVRLLEPHSNRSKDQGSSLRDKLSNIIKSNSKESKNVEKIVDDIKEKNGSINSINNNVQQNLEKNSESVNPNVTKVAKSENVNETETNSNIEAEVKVLKQISVSTTKPDNIKIPVSNVETESKGKKIFLDEDDEDLELRMIALRSAVMKKSQKRKKNKRKSSPIPCIESPFTSNFNEDFPLLAKICSPDSPLSSPSPLKEVDKVNKTNNNPEDMDIDSDIDYPCENNISNKDGGEENGSLSPYSPSDDLTIENELPEEGENAKNDKNNLISTPLLNSHIKSNFDLSLYSPSKPTETPIKQTADALKCDNISFPQDINNSLVSETKEKEVDACIQENHQSVSEYEEEERPYSPSDATTYDPELPGLLSGEQSELISTDVVKENTVNNKEDASCLNIEKESSTNEFSQSQQTFCGTEPMLKLLLDKLGETDIDGSPLVPIESNEIYENTNLGESALFPLEHDQIVAETAVIINPEAQLSEELQQINGIQNKIEPVLIAKGVSFKPLKINANPKKNIIVNPPPAFIENEESNCSPINILPKRKRKRLRKLKKKSVQAIVDAILEDHPLNDKEHNGFMEKEPKQKKNLSDINLLKSNDKKIDKTVRMSKNLAFKRSDERFGKSYKDRTRILLRDRRKSESSEKKCKNELRKRSYSKESYESTKSRHNSKEATAKAVDTGEKCVTVDSKSNDIRDKKRRMSADEDEFTLREILLASLAKRNKLKAVGNNSEANKPIQSNLITENEETVKNPSNTSILSTPAEIEKEENFKICPSPPESTEKQNSEMIETENSQKVTSESMEVDTKTDTTERDAVAHISVEAATLDTNNSCATTQVNSLLSKDIENVNKMEQIAKKRPADFDAQDLSVKKFAKKIPTVISNKVVSISKRYPDLKKISTIKKNGKNAHVKVNSINKVQKFSALHEKSNNTKKSLSSQVKRLVINFNESSDSESESDTNTNKKNEITIRPKLVIPTSEFEESLDQFLKSARKNQEMGTSATKTTAGATSVSLASVPSTTATSEKTPLHTSSSTLSPISSDKLITTSTKSKIPITPNSSLNKIIVSKNKILTTPKNTKDTRIPSLFSSTPQAIKHLPVQQQEQYRRLKQEIFEREKLRLKQNAEKLSQQSKSISATNISSSKTLVTTSATLSSPSATITSPIADTAECSTEKERKSSEKCVGGEGEMPNNSSKHSDSPKETDDTVCNTESIISAITKPTVALTIQVTSTDKKENSNKQNSEKISDIVQHLDNSSEKEKTINQNADENEEKSKEPKLDKLIDSILVKNPMHMDYPNSVKIPVIRILTRDQINLKTTKIQTKVGLDVQVNMDDLNRISENITENTKKIQVTDGEKSDDCEIILERPAHDVSSSMPSNLSSSSSLVAQNKGSIENCASTSLKNPSTFDNVKKTLLSKSIVNTETNSIQKAITRQANDHNVIAKTSFEDFKDVVDSEIVNLKELAKDEQFQFLRKYEENLIAKRFQVLDDLTEMSANLRQWEVEKDIHAKLLLEIKKLQEQLKISEKKMHDQREIINSIQPRVTSTSEKINIGRKECFRLSKICSSLGNCVIGSDYKIPSTGYELYQNRLKEVASHTKKLKSKKPSASSSSNKDSINANNNSNKIQETSDTSENGARNEFIGCNKNSKKTADSEVFLTGKINYLNTNNSVKSSEGETSIISDESIIVIENITNDEVFTATEKSNIGTSHNDNESIIKVGNINDNNLSIKQGIVVANKAHSDLNSGEKNNINEENVHSHKVNQATNNDVDSITCTSKEQNVNPEKSSTIEQNTTLLPTKNPDTMPSDAAFQSVETTKTDDQIRTKIIKPYESILKHMNTTRNSKADGILCPYELMGTCNDSDCQFIHQTTSHCR